MPILKYRSRAFVGISQLVPEITYVMCGARGEGTNRVTRVFPQLRFVGFEPDRAEYERLSSHQNHAYKYVNAAVAARNEPRTLYITRNPACSSLLRPNHSLYSHFLGCGPDLEVIGEKSIEVKSLDSALPQIGIRTVDFLDLDTQGSELEILQGADGFLSRDTVGIKCEVEFSPLYLNQPLFGEVDAHLRKLGFMLFDLTRSRYRRAAFPAYALTRGQLLWGDALYLRNYQTFPAELGKQPLIKLFLFAAYLQFHDYALEVLNFLIAGGAEELTPEECAILKSAREQYLKDLGRGARWIGLVLALESLGLRRPLKLVGRLASQLGDRLLRDRKMTEYNWVD